MHIYLTEEEKKAHQELLKKMNQDQKNQIRNETGTAMSKKELQRILQTRSSTGFTK